MLAVWKPLVWVGKRPAFFPLELSVNFLLIVTPNLNVQQQKGTGRGYGGRSRPLGHMQNLLWAAG